MNMEATETELTAKPERVTQSMKDGQARAYADKGFRDYLVHCAQVANSNVLTAMRTNRPELAKEFAHRFEIFNNLLNHCKEAYLHSALSKPKTGNLPVSLEEKLKTEKI